MNDIISISPLAVAMEKKYQVFISFRGEDTRLKFTSHFHSRLTDKKIKTFIDDSLDRGDDISSALLRAIEESEISVVIFSENYAESRWCLDELLHIMECKKKYGQIVLPVFYEVEPSHVRHQSDTFHTALMKLERRLSLDGRFEPEKLQMWKNALTQTGKMSGFVTDCTRRESEFVDEIIQSILEKLQRASSSGNDFKGIIGIDKSFEQVEELISKNLIVGIWGMGGLGKTTLARFVFEKLSPQFEGCCFLANVREELAGKSGFDGLEVKLVSELLEEGNIKRVTSFHKNRLRCKRVLIVLDDVDDPVHLQSLAGDDGRFGDGSKIIVTTRNAEVLRNKTKRYELKCLNSDDASKLFCLNAFKTTTPRSTDDIEIAKRVVDYVDGNPLALNVLGSFLHSKRREKWGLELDKLKQVLHGKIHIILKTSYDGLDEREQRIFLDIACFTDGHANRNYVECISGDPLANICIDSLIDRSLISIEANNILGMHDLVREMGHEIVRQQSTEEPGKRSRIWADEDINHVSKYNTGSPKIEGIYGWIFEAELSPTFFSNMYNLRLLSINGVKLPEGLQWLPDTLTCLEWHDWPLKYLPTKFVPHNLVVLKMPGSKLERLWSGVQNLNKLRYIDLNFSENLIELPDLSAASNLESVNLSFCKRLRRIPSCLSFRVVESFPLLSQCDSECEAWECWSIGYLDLTGCEGLEIFPEISGSVREIRCAHSSIQTFPSSFCYLNSLECLNLGSVHTLPELPRRIVDLNFQELHSFLFESFSSLEKLSMSDCCNLLSLPSNIWKLKSLQSLDISLCYRLETFPEILEIRKLPATIVNLVGLESLEMRYFINLEILPENMNELHKLVILDISNCKNLKSLPLLPLSLQYLDASRCKNLERVSDSSAVLTRGWAKNEFSPQSRVFMYDFCLKLDAKMCNILVTEFQIRCLYTATIHASERGGSTRVTVCLPEKKVPEWFNLQSEGASLHVTLPSDNNNFLGVALCVVVENARLQIQVRCKIYIKTKQGERSLSSAYTSSQEERPRHLLSEIMLMWYEYQDYHNWHDVAELRFEFNVPITHKIVNYCCLVKSCGIRLLKQQDIEELGIATNQHEML